MNVRSPRLNAESFQCSRCKAFAHQDWHKLYLIPDPGGLPQRFEDETIFLSTGASTFTTSSASHWSVSKCFSCGKYSVWRGKEIVYPESRFEVSPPHDLMSPAAAELYTEAALVLPISRRAATALARASMESELRYLLSDERADLHTLIGKLSDKVSSSLWQSLTVLRDTGNKALHGGVSGVVAILLDKSDADLAPFLLSAVNQIVDEMVARPKLAAELFEMLPEGVRQNAESKRVRD